MGARRWRECPEFIRPDDEGDLRIGRLHPTTFQTDKERIESTLLMLHEAALNQACDRLNVVLLMPAVDRRRSLPIHRDSAVAVAVAVAVAECSRPNARMPDAAREAAEQNSAEEKLQTLAAEVSSSDGKRMTHLQSVGTNLPHSFLLGSQADDMIQIC